MKRLAVFGAGGHTDEFRSLSGLDFDVFVDDQYAVGDLKRFSDFDKERWKAIVCVGDSKDRKRIVESFPEGTEFFSYVHPTSVVGEDVEIGEGSYVGPFCVITTKISIGKHALINRGVQIGHDTSIGDYFSAMPGSVVSGNNKIGDCVYMGTNSSTRHKISVHDNVTLGMGSALVKSTNSSGKYLGVPAKSKTKVSVVIPCYNFQDYIKTAIDGVLAQKSDFEIEVIVGDDCSTDDSYKIIESYGNRIKHYRNEKNIGAFENIKKLFSLCKGEYISYLDGDDVILDDEKLKRQVEFLDNNPDYSMHCTGSYVVDRNGTVTKTHLIPLREELTKDDIRNGNLVSFGRTFRNFKDIQLDWMSQAPYIDWCINFEVSLRGKVKCDEWASGGYRVTLDGMITGDTDEEVYRKNRICLDLISDRQAAFEDVKTKN